MLFVKVLMIAAIVAVPLAWYLSSQWLQNFVYRIPVNAVTYLFGFGIILMLTIVTVSFESIKASMANPINSLRYE